MFPADLLCFTATCLRKKKFRLNYCSIGDNGPFFYNYNTILHGVSSVIAVWQQFANIDFYVVADARIFIDNSIADVAPVANAHKRRVADVRLLNLVERFVIIAAHYIAIFNDGTETNPCADTDDRTGNMAGIYNTTIGDDSFVHMRPRHFGWRKHTGAGIDRPAVEQVKL